MGGGVVSNWENSETIFSLIKEKVIWEMKAFSCVWSILNGNIFLKLAWPCYDHRRGGPHDSQQK